MSSETILLSIAVFLACSAVQLAVGAFIGWRLARSRHLSRGPAMAGEPSGFDPAGAPDAAPPKDDTFDPDEAQELLIRLHELTSGVAEGIGEHNHRVQDFGRELSTANRRSAGDLPATLVRAVARMHEANQALQGQLAAASEQIQEQKQQIDARVAEASTDGLTGLPNRRAFDDELTRRLAQRRRQRTGVSLIMVDIDHFKRFNDEHGHLVGDAVLRGVARTLSASVGEAGLSARFGGEEFAVVLAGTPAVESKRIAARVRAAIAAATIDHEGKTHSVTASVGLALADDADDAAGFIKRADEALYASKKAHRNCAHWHDGQACFLIDELSLADAPDAPGAAPALADHARHVAEALADSLTRLPNRRALLDDLNRRMAERRRTGTALALMLVEVDGLRGLRTAQGRLAGDLALRATAQFLASAVREMDVVSRYNDAQFGVLLPGAEAGDAFGAAERVRQAIEGCRSLDLAGEEVTFTVSIGISHAMLGDDGHALLDRATSALHAAIHAGRNTIRSLPEAKSPAATAVDAALSA
jgi:diguanylate cyclase